MRTPWSCFCIGAVLFRNCHAAQYFHAAKIDNGKDHFSGSRPQEKIVAVPNYTTKVATTQKKSRNTNASPQSQVGTIQNMNGLNEKTVALLIPLTVIMLLLCAGVIVFAIAYRKVGTEEDLRRLPTYDAEDIVHTLIHNDFTSGVRQVEDMQQCVEGSELCMYTCLALYYGKEGMSKSICWLMPKMLVLIGMQVVVPMMVLSYRFQQEHLLGEAIDQSLTIRITGFVLYVYSIYNLYHGASDEARTDFLQLATHYDYSWSYILPAVAGEVINAFVASSLASATFIIFSALSTPVDLIIYAVAMNFLGNIDNDMVEREEREKCFEIFKELTVVKRAASLESKPALKFAAMASLLFICRWVRILFVAVAGLIFAASLLAGLRWAS